MPRDIVQDWSGNDPSFRQWRISLGENTPHLELRFRSGALGESTHVRDRPINNFDALMRCAPGDEPQRTMRATLTERQRVHAALEQLDERLQYVIQAIYFERLSYRQLARRMGISKTYAFKLTRQAEEEMMKLLTQPTWNEAAREAVESLSPVGLAMTDPQAETVIKRKVEQLRAIVNSHQRTDVSLGASLRVIGLCAADMLSERGLWDIDEITALLCRKQHDYGHDNILAFGHIGLAVRCSDKVARWFNLADKSSQAEPAIDALLDMVGYAAISQMLLEDTFKLELEEL